MPRHRPATATAATNTAASPEDFAPLTEADIADQTDAGSFERGRRYHRSGQIFDAARRGATLSAQCHGSSGGPYVVEATLAAAGEAGDNPVDFACDCPRGGFCKHIVALLLGWIDDPDQFEPRPPLSALLAERSRDELAALVERMVRRHPELEALIELPLPGSDATAHPADEATVRRQVAAAFRLDRDDPWHAAAAAAGALESVLAVGERYATDGRWDDAVTVYTTVADGVLDRYEEVRDDEGDLGSIVVACDDGLAKVLDAASDAPGPSPLSPERRARAIRAVFDIWKADVELGGLDLSQEGPEAFARVATEDEAAMVGGWLRALMEAPAAGDDYHRSWVNRAAIGFLSLLGGDAGLSDEQLLEEYRKAELWQEAADSLVRMGRVEEAIGLAARRLTAAGILIAFADRLIAGDPERAAQAIALVDARLWEKEGSNKHEDGVYLEWLSRRYAEHGMVDKALAAAKRRFEALPNLHTYAEVKTAATLPDQPADRWAKTRPDLLKTLAKSNNWHAVAEARLTEGEIAEALAAVDKLSKSRSTPGWGGWGWSGSYAAATDGIEARVAAAAEKEQPDRAVAIYQRLADQLIAGRGRPAYQQAAQLLTRVKRVQEDRGEEAAWGSFIADLRAQNKSLRALREELDALGL